LIFGGFWSFLFGTFVFAEAFGIPFHAPVEAAAGSAEAFNWSQNILAFNIPIYPLMEKLHQVADFMTLSMVIAYLHLGLGLIFGIVDEYPHGRKHALGKLGWFLLLTSIFSVIMTRAARWPGLGHAVWYGPFVWFPKAGFPYEALGFTASNPVAWASVGLLVAGLGLIVATEANNLLEVITLIANTISYARIAGIGVAEEAVIFAFNTIGLTYFIFPGQAHGNLGLVIGGSLFIAVMNVLVFLLATLSSSIQSIRLNYVEFFLKFYKGTGRVFHPFGERTLQEV
jgi:V/A-type H+/Na+-transporting ATPase subunit I